MARETRCQVCRHPQRAKIEALCVGDWRLTAVAKKFSVGVSALSRHMSGHVTVERKTAIMCGASQIEQLRLIAARENGTVLEDLVTLRSILMGQVVQRAEAGDTFKVSNAAARLLDVLKEIGHITGEIVQMNPALSLTVNNVSVLTNPVFLDVQTSILDALRPFPDARAAVIAALRGSDVAPPIMIEERAVA